MRSSPPCRAVAALLCSCGLITPARAQRLDTAVPLPAPTGATAAERYEPVFDALRRLAPRSDSVATIHNLTLQRDAIQFRFAEGRLYLLTPVAGRTVGAVFVGRGAVSFMPPLAVERGQMSHILGDSVLNTPLSAAVLIFTDSTLWELTRQLSFGPGAEAELARELPQRGISENQHSGGKRRIEDGVAEDVAHLAALDRERRHERDRAPPHEHRAHRATRDGGQQVQAALREAELDGIALQREVVNRGDAVAPWRQPAQRVEHRLVTLGGGGTRRRGERHR